MKNILIIIAFILYYTDIKAQDISIGEFYEVATSGKIAYEDIVKKHALERKDNQEGSPMSRKNEIRFVSYGPIDESSKKDFNLFTMLEYRQKRLAILYTDNKDYWLNYYTQIKNNDEYYRASHLEGSAKPATDWVYKLKKNPYYKISFIKNIGQEEGDYSFVITYSY
ncbi:hypothetical protein [Mesonia sp. HuA40]|uniref:hypothetical protein n=1 Tax=Mesonia sp. HuA40 TaxID=2602761 RepID=UPI0011CB259B|nr:hypothetical protein [Mesonia sp. HuA40]TXK71712.1 hypothetical protein FT993_08740 [Mesonia sp. HuA40]